ncbi:SAM-dependent DNA methylase domain-containing protein [Desulfonema magnum]|uniref:SAM-dependent DNA methylase domain-containing protein n=1 Tax=Desulfonema magnum TaxID=45655 RepID=A0A975GP40_9BACT|nr:SAM-dependent DNA methylase domain-containing protein [Desulfonema magnum]
MNNKIQIIQSDALSELKNIKSASVDLVIAASPYNLGRNYEP